MTVNHLPYPFKSIPLYKEKPWGGRKLEELFGKDLPEEKKTGEAWEVAAIPEGSSIIANGYMQGKSLAEAVEQWSVDLIGTSWNEINSFPLLVKILDAQEDLSVQVHPGEEDCLKYFPDEHSKDETWIILDADTDGAIYKGFEKDVIPKDFDEAIENNTVEKILRKIPVKRGDAVRIPPGIVHALKRGVVVLEIQQPSDSTFRIYDYGRTPGGNPRELHLEEAKKVLRYSYDEQPFLIPDYMKAPFSNRELLIDCPAYRIEYWQFLENVMLTEKPETVRIIFVTEGRCRIENHDIKINLKRGDTAVIPAVSHQIKLVPDGLAKVITTGAPGVNLL